MNTPILLFFNRSSQTASFSKWLVTARVVHTAGNNAASSFLIFPHDDIGFYYKGKLVDRCGTRQQCTALVK